MKNSIETPLQLVNLINGKHMQVQSMVTKMQPRNPKPLQLIVKRKNIINQNCETHSTFINQTENTNRTILA